MFRVPLPVIAAINSVLFHSLSLSKSISFTLDCSKALTLETPSTKVYKKNLLYASLLLSKRSGIKANAERKL